MIASRRLVVAAVALALVAGTAPAAVSAPGPTGPRRVVVTLRDQASLAALPASRAARLREVVRRRRARADADLPAFRARLRAWRRAGDAVGEMTPLWIVNGFTVTAGPAVVARLRSDPAVASVVPDEAAVAPADTPAEPGIAAVGAPALWGLGRSGQGIVVATLDTGVDVGHPDLAAGWRGGPGDWFDPFGQHPAAPVDADGHGTAVMGVIAGGAAGGTSIGVAPGVRWTAARIFDDSGSSSLTAIHQAFQWVLDPDGDPATPDAPQVVNSSWGFTSPGCVTAVAPDVLALRAAGVLPVFAAGNQGTSGNISPGNNPGAFAVGATTSAGVAASFSSRGPGACGDAGVFPEISAPGVSVRSSQAGGGYASLSGTSLAAPHAAGALALILEAHPGLTPAQQEAVLEQGARDLGAVGPDDVYGYGGLDVPAADAAAAALQAPDTLGPVTSGAAASPALVASGPVGLTAMAADAGSTVAAAEWFEGDDPGVGNGTPMAASDGAFDGASEAVEAAVDSGPLAPGAHQIGVRARDAGGNWGAPASVTLVVDRTGPAVAGVAAEAPSAGQIHVSAVATDAESGVTAAEWFAGTDPGAGAGAAMAAADGAFGDPSEAVTGTGPLAPGAHVVSVRARDAVGHWGDPQSVGVVVPAVPDPPAPLTAPDPPPAPPATPGPVAAVGTGPAAATASPAQGAQPPAAAPARRTTVRRVVRRVRRCSRVRRSSGRVVRRCRVVRVVRIVRTPRD